MAELGEPFGRLWTLLVETHGELDAARTLAGVLAAVCAHGEETVKLAVTTALATQRTDLLALTAVLSQRPERNPVPASIAAYEVTIACAADYDHLLVAAHA